MAWVNQLHLGLTWTGGQHVALLVGCGALVLVVVALVALVRVWRAPALTGTMRRSASSTSELQTFEYVQFTSCDSPQRERPPGAPRRATPSRMAKAAASRVRGP